MIGKKRVAGVLLAGCVMVSLCACNSQETAGGTADSTSDGNSIVVAQEENTSIIGTWYFTQDSYLEVYSYAHHAVQAGDSIQFYNDGTFVIEHIDASRSSYDGDYELVHDGNAIAIASLISDFQIDGDSLEIYQRKGTWYLSREYPE